MPLKTVAILSPGDMGHAVGRALREGGLNVITCLQGRSKRTGRLAQQAGIEDVPSLEELVSKADLVLSIMVPAEAVSLARQVAQALHDSGSDTYFADCNAISPQTTKEIEGIITTAGGRYIDASIVGSPPGKGKPPRFYTSGEHCPVMSEMDGMSISVRPLGNEIGRASGIKMCYAGLTKGTSALHIAVLSAAEAMGLSEELRAEFSSSQPHALQQMESGISRLPSRAFRWIGEMEEIAATYDHLGVTPHFHKGAAEVYRLLSETSFASEEAESVDTNRTTAQTIKATVGLLDSHADKSS